MLRDVPQRRGPPGPEPAVLDARTTWPGCIAEVKEALEVPIAGVVSDGQDSIRKAVERGPRRRAPPALPLPLPPRGGQADLRGRPPRQGAAEEAGPRRPADRAEGRGPRRRRRRRRSGATAPRSARRLTDDGRPPLAAPGLELQGAAGGGGREPRPGRGKKGLPTELTRLRALLARGLEATAALWPAGARRPTTGCSGPRRSWRTWPG